MSIQSKTVFDQYSSQGKHQLPATVVFKTDRMLSHMYLAARLVERVLSETPDIHVILISDNSIELRTMFNSTKNLWVIPATSIPLVALFVKMALDTIPKTDKMLIILDQVPNSETLDWTDVSTSGCSTLVLSSSGSFPRSKDTITVYSKPLCTYVEEVGVVCNYNGTRHEFVASVRSCGIEPIPDGIDIPVLRNWMSCHRGLPPFIWMKGVDDVANHPFVKAVIDHVKQSLNVDKLPEKGWMTPVRTIVALDRVSSLSWLAVFNTIRAGGTGIIGGDDDPRLHGATVVTPCGDDTYQVFHDGPLSLQRTMVRIKDGALVQTCHEFTPHQRSKGITLTIDFDAILKLQNRT